MAKILILFLMLLFYICYITKMISQKKQGIDTDQLGKDKEGFVKFIEVSLKLISYLIIVVQLLSIYFYNLKDTTLLQIAGIIITAFGVSIFVVSIIQMKDNWRAGASKKDQTNLVTEGIYSISRNPAFLGFDLMYIGILMAFFNWYLFIVTFIAISLFHLQIVNVEEDFLIERFNNEYLSYRCKVNRYFGRKNRKDNN